MCEVVRCERRHYVQANAANRTTTVPVAGRKSLHHKTLWVPPFAKGGRLCASGRSYTRRYVTAGRQDS